LWIVPLPVPSSIVPPLAEDSCTTKLSSGCSSAVSPIVSTVIDWTVSPGANATGSDDIAV
jgi:hypothetical protein